jgi:7,8-dihydropterin-6-yl-methyl-4-(beta-D-ribofuranosyl)aminobenzene 5'-phosphate synthase
VPTVTPTEAALAVTITVLYDNNEYDERLRTAWGFACLVEGFDETILFDTGGDSGTLLSNMRTLGVDPQRIDTVVISHVHGDHVGGLDGFLNENQAVTVYLPQSFPQSIEDAARDAGADVVSVGESVEVCEHVLSTGELGDGIKEQSLVIETARGLVVVTGCAHPGIVDIVRQAKEITGQDVYLVVGGFHLGGTGTVEIEGIVEDFQRLGVQKVAPCHCSGDAARRLFEEAYGEDFIPAGVGSTLQVRD